MPHQRKPKMSKEEKRRRKLELSSSKTEEKFIDNKNIDKSICANDEISSVQNEKVTSDTNDNKSEMSVTKKKKKHKDRIQVDIEENMTTEKIEKQSSSSAGDDSKSEASLKTKKRKHKDKKQVCDIVDGEEKTSSEKKIKYTGEYFGDKPTKAEEKNSKDQLQSTEKSVETEGPSKKEKSLEYIKQWNSDRLQWKFQKSKQVWLLKHLYQVNEIPDDSFSILLTYMAGLKGKSRETTVAEAEQCLQSLESNSEDESSSGVNDPVKYERARQVLQALS